MKFRRSKAQDEATPDAAPAADEAAPDPASWALPADAAVAAGGDVAPTPEADEVPDFEDAVPEPAPALSGATVTAPAAGLEDGPRAAAAAAAGSFATPPAPKPTDKPELIVAGAFAGAFLFAKILKRIGD